MVKIHTIQIILAEKLGIVSSRNYLDITAKSASIFAPSWLLLNGYRYGKITEAEYTKRYLALMRRLYKKSSYCFHEVADMEDVILACYCRAGEFCHRLILKDIFVKMGGKYIGEIDKDVVESTQKLIESE